MEEELRKVGYCSYCKEKILSNESYVIDPQDRIYHVYCYGQETFTEDLDGVTYNEF